MRLRTQLCLPFLALLVQISSAENPFNARQNVEGDLLASPRSNVVMQSVVLGRRHPHIIHREFDDDYDDNKDLILLLRRILGTRRYPRPYPYKKTAMDELDTEQINPETLDKIASSAQKSKRKQKEEEDVGWERMIEAEKPKRSRRHRDSKNRRDFKDYEEEVPYSKIRKADFLEEEEEGGSGRRQRERKRRHWEPLLPSEDDMTKTEREPLAGEEEWLRRSPKTHGSHKDMPYFHYLPGLTSTGLHYNKPASLEEYR